MVQFRKPKVDDIPGIWSRLAPLMAAERILPRSEQSLCERLRDYTVAEEGHAVVGVASIRLIDPDLAEVGALVADSDNIKAQLLEKVLDEALNLGAGKAFVLTANTIAYETAGFERCSLQSIPQKRDRQCIHCPRLQRCQQIALRIDLSAA